MSEKKASRAKRIAGVLSRYADDTEKVQVLSRLLNYNPKVLPEDMKAVLEYIDQLEEQINPNPYEDFYK